MEAAIDAAHAAGRKVAFTLSDTFCVDRHRDGFWQLLDDGKDRHPVRQRGGDRGDGREPAMSKRPSPRSPQVVPTLVVTRSEKGAIAVAGGERADVPAEPIERLVDTTGAGDLFAAGFLAGQARGHEPREPR